MAALPPSNFGLHPSQYATESGSSQMGFGSAENGAVESTGEGNFVPRPKRIACVLEARLAQVETLLKGQDPEPPQRTSPPQPVENSFGAPINDESVLALPDLSGLGGDMNGPFQPSNPPDAIQSGQTMYPPIANTGSDPQTQWDLIALGLEEPLPSQDVIDELDAIFFEKVYQMLPIIHRPRYFASLNLAPHMRPPICLRYIMWCHAASASDKYFFLHSHFYQRARKYAEADEMKGFGESVVSLAHCQTWILIGTYEFRMIFFPRAWLSVGKAARLALMLGLNRLDGVGLDVKQSISPPRDWTEREERRRVFWGAFATDRYASVGTGWPLLIDEDDIMTNLPASEDSFLKSKPQRTLRLSDIIAGEGVATLSPFACVVVLTSLFGRNLVHIHRPRPNDNDHDLNGEFWKRHRSHDNILLHIALSLPDHLRLPSGMSDVNVIFANMSIHTSTICLHQAAIFKTEKNKMPNQITIESKRRCLVAANQISSIMKMISHVDLTSLNPFISFCLYIAARVFVQYLKSRPEDSSVHSSLQFVVSALNAMKNKNPLTESFLVQLDVDLDGTGIRALDDRQKESVRASQVMAVHQNFCNDAVECSPIYNLRQTQTAGTMEESPQHSTGHANKRQHMNTGTTTSLPSRQRDTMASSTDENIHNLFTPATQTTSQINEQPGSGSKLDLDMDFSPDFGTLSERNNPPSDHPTPSTLNSSSNTSYSINGVDNPSPGRQQPKSGPTYPNQESTQSFNKMNAIHMSPGDISSQAPDINALLARAYQNNSGSPAMPTDTSNPFSIPPVWDLPTPSQETGAADFSNLNVGALTEAQWAQILGENGVTPSWESWRQS
ncbi:hypothetical protein PENANT_c005G10767 [Penicillium antarcticum]|uniref:Xylanolytic transcriptional activator regulatory domain-containing protein n=1 Tax=Penicillium antarcticum TaxID=416450 RepID=A0A1V6QFC1_9EURO|nr:hypothetical protein PENANT_c005G10767 [Penicillium antarcticum]